MKKLFLNMLMVALVALTGTAVMAQDEEPPTDTKKPAVKKAKKAGTSEVAKAVKKASPVQQGKLNPNAKCYVYLQSASWCPPCRAEMPNIVKAYKEMKAAGVEVILCGRDRDKAGVKGYIKAFKIPFCAVVAHEKLGLPGFRYSGSVPHATFVDRNGKVLRDGHGSITLDWKSVVDKIPDEEEESAE